MKKFVSKVKLTGGVALGCGAFEYISSAIVFNVVWNAGKLLAKWSWKEGCSGALDTRVMHYAELNQAIGSICTRIFIIILQPFEIWYNSRNYKLLEGYVLGQSRIVKSYCRKQDILRKTFKSHLKNLMKWFNFHARKFLSIILDFKWGKRYPRAPLCISLLSVRTGGY